MTTRDIIVIGASAGGVPAVIELARHLPPDLPAALLIVIHMSASSPGMLFKLIDAAGRLPATVARHGEPVRLGHIYVARPDHHLLLSDGAIHLSRGPKENGFRPAVDPLFRTAAAAFGPRVVGVVLSGGMNDGTAGLKEIKRQGGVAIVQDPRTAMQDSMPASAIHHVHVDQVLPVSRMAAALTRYVGNGIAGGHVVMGHKKPSDKPDVAEAADLALNNTDLPGAPSGFVCPECGGALWELTDGKLTKYRCHVGHGFTAEALVNEQGRALENALWTALRALEENAALRRRMAERLTDASLAGLAREYETRARDAEERAALIREVLLADRIPPQTAAVRARRAGQRSNLSRKAAGDSPKRPRKT